MQIKIFFFKNDFNLVFCSKSINFQRQRIKIFVKLSVFFNILKAIILKIFFKIVEAPFHSFKKALNQEAISTIPFDNIRSLTKLKLSLSIQHRKLKYCGSIDRPIMESNRCFRGNGEPFSKFSIVVRAHNLCTVCERPPKSVHSVTECFTTAPRQLEGSKVPAGSLNQYQEFLRPPWDLFDTLGCRYLFTRETVLKASFTPPEEYQQISHCLPPSGSPSLAKTFLHR